MSSKCLVRFPQPTRRCFGHIEPLIQLLVHDEAAGQQVSRSADVGIFGLDNYIQYIYIIYIIIDHMYDILFYIVIICYLYLEVNGETSIFYHQLTARPRASRPGGLWSPNGC